MNDKYIVHHDTKDDDSSENEEKTFEGTLKYREKMSHSFNHTTFLVDSPVEAKRSRRTMGHRKMAAKQKKIEFKKLFVENKHRFDMSCDLCPTLFDTIDDARNHYATTHEHFKGYIKCCNAKLTYRCEIVKHIYRHLKPERFTCVSYGFIIQCYTIGSMVCTD